MGNYIVRNLPQIKLTDLLRKRRTSLAKYVASYGIFTYPALEERCRKIGVSPPTEAEFLKVVTPGVSAPQEGIVVMEPPPIIMESTGQKIEEEFTEIQVEKSDAQKSKKKAKREKQFDSEIFVNEKED